MSDISGFGSRDEAREFIERHRLFFDRFPNLKEALRVAFVREFATEANADKVVFYSGRLAVEDSGCSCLISSSNNNTSTWKISKKYWPAAGATLRRSRRRDKSVSFRGDAVPKCGMTRRTRS